MKAFLLAGGIGSRLRPLTDLTPKCLLMIDGDCLLDLWLDAFERTGVEEVLINLHHLPDKVRDHIAIRTGGPTIRTALEPVLLGSAGTLLAHREWVQDEEMFLVCNADNLTDFDLRVLVDAHHSSGEIATIAVFHADQPHACGIVTIDGTGRMVEYAEKPTRPLGNLANAGMYAFAPDALEVLDGDPPIDIGYDLLPLLVGRAQTVEITGYCRDIGTPHSYLQARQEWPARAIR